MKKEESKTSKLAIASLVLGILSIITGWIPVIGWIILILTFVLSSKSKKSINENKDLKGLKLAKTAKILGYIGLAISVLFTILLIWEIFFGTKFMKAVSISDMSAFPGQIISVQYEGIKGTEWGEKDYIMFYDFTGFMVKVNPILVPNSDRLLFMVPPYIDMATGKFSPGRVNIQVVKGEKMDFINEFEIRELPFVNVKPGTVTLAFIEGAIATAKEAKKMTLLQAEISNSEADKGLIAALDESVVAYTALENEVKSVMAGTKTRVQFADVNGEVFEYDVAMLADIDRLYAALLQDREEPIPISGSVTSEAGSYTDSCSNLEGMKMSGVLHCGTKRMEFTDMMVNLVDLIGKFSSNPLMKTIGSVSGPVYFVTYTLPKDLAAYEEKLESITASTGEEEYRQISQLRGYYTEKILIGAFDSFTLGLGTGIKKGINAMAGMIMGESSKDAFDGVITRNDMRQEMFNDGRLPSQSGLDMIVCDLCKKTEEKKEQPETEEETPSKEEWQPETEQEDEKTPWYEKWLPGTEEPTKKLYFNPKSPECNNYVFTQDEYGSCSFCEPAPQSKTGLCCGPGQTCTNPTGGKSPYHFQLDTMGGFPPMGLSLNLNGMLTGTPSKAGQYNFRICAVDISEDSDCKPVDIKVEPKEEEPEEECNDEEYWACQSDCDDKYPDPYRWGCVKGYEEKCAADAALRDACFANCKSQCEEEPEEEQEEEPEEEPEGSSGSGCYCSYGGKACTTNEECPEDPNWPGVPGFCACAAG